MGGYRAGCAEVPEGGVCTVKAKRVLFTVFCLSLLLPLGTAFGDGGMFFPKSTSKDVLQPTQKVYIRWDGSQEKLLVQTKYQGPAEEMVWIVPVPSQPAVELGDGTVFNSLSLETASLDVSYTSFAGLPTWSSGASAGTGTRGPASPVEWQEQIGEYDVVLLRPIGEEDVVQWLQSNGFAIPDTIVPILNDYVRKQWWMVVATIHPDALTNITRNQLAQGLLHPLELTFTSSACVYPMRLTSMAGGPVEELIYIEGPAHYEPATLVGGAWTVSISGGPIRHVLDNTGLSDLEVAVRTREGQTQTTVKRHLTKLRRVFQPSEMTDDLVFRTLDYATWLAGPDPNRIAQAATQYGRNRDPNGIPFLIAALSPAAFEQVEPVPEDYVPGWLRSVRSVTPDVGRQVRDPLPAPARLPLGDRRDRHRTRAPGSGGGDAPTLRPPRQPAHPDGSVYRLDQTGLDEDRLRLHGPSRRGPDAYFHSWGAVPVSGDHLEGRDGHRHPLDRAMRDGRGEGCSGGGADTDHPVFIRRFRVLRRELAELGRGAGDAARRPSPARAAGPNPGRPPEQLCAGPGASFSRQS